jgi:hypothetical protein
MIESLPQALIIKTARTLVGCSKQAVWKVCLRRKRVYEREQREVPCFMITVLALYLKTENVNAA